MIQLPFAYNPYVIERSIKPRRKKAKTKFVFSLDLNCKQMAIV